MSKTFRVLITKRYIETFSLYYVRVTIKKDDNCVFKSNVHFLLILHCLYFWESLTLIKTFSIKVATIFSNFGKS